MEKRPPPPDLSEFERAAFIVRGARVVVRSAAGGGVYTARVLDVRPWLIYLEAPYHEGAVHPSRVLRMAPD